jgi:hypothetical protein
MCPDEGATTTIKRADHGTHPCRCVSSMALSVPLALVACSLLTSLPYPSAICAPSLQAEHRRSHHRPGYNAKNSWCRWRMSCQATVPVVPL